VAFVLHSNRHESNGSPASVARSKKTFTISYDMVHFWHLVLNMRERAHREGYQIARLLETTRHSLPSKNYDSSAHFQCSGQSPLLKKVNYEQAAV
jgi:hypothetical protein